MAFTNRQLKYIHHFFTPILPLVYDDSLSYAEQVAKFAKTLNNTISQVNDISNVITTLASETAQTLFINVTNPGDGFKPMIGDGNTDNTEAFSALAQLDDAVLFFPAGIYATKPVECSADIVGAGVYSSQILGLNDNTTKPVLKMLKNSSIANIHINGNKGGQSASKACLELTTYNVATGVRCYNGDEGFEITGTAVFAMMKSVHCNNCGSVTGDHVVALIDENENGAPIENHGAHNLVASNYGIYATVQNVDIEASDSVDVSAQSVKVESPVSVTGNVTTTGKVTANGGAEFGGEDIVLGSVNPVTYRNPIATGGFFDTVPVKGSGGEYSVLVANENTENLTTTFISGDEGEDITTKLNNALATGNVILDPAHNYTVSDGINVPDEHCLDGQGCVIKYVGAGGGFVLNVGQSYTYSGVHTSCQIRNIKIDCDRKSNGVYVRNKTCYLAGVLVRSPIEVGFRIFDEAHNSQPCDATIDGCFVESATPYEYGFQIYGTDYNLSKLRTMRSRIGIYCYGDSGFMTDCHPFGYESRGDNWENTYGFYLASNTYHLVNCYSDNFRYGIHVKASARVGICNFVYYCYEYNTPNSTLQRYLFHTDGNDAIVVTGIGIKYPRDKGVLAFNHNIPYQGVKLAPKTNLITMQAPEASAGIQLNNGFLMCMNYDTSYYLKPATTGKGPFLVAAFLNASEAPESWGSIDIHCRTFNVTGVSVRGTTSGVTLSFPGVLTSAGTNQTATLTLYKDSKNNGYLYLTSTQDIAEMSVETHGNSELFIPRVVTSITTPSLTQVTSTTIQQK